MYMHPSVHRQLQEQLYLAGNGATASGEEEDEDSDEDAGVQVEVTERAGGDYGVQTRAGASAAAGNRGSGGGQAKRGAARRTK